MKRYVRASLARGVACAAVVVLASLGAMAPACADDDPPPAPPALGRPDDPGDDGPDGPPLPDKQILDFQMWRMTQDLQLTDADAARVFPRLRKLGEAQSQLRRDRMKLMKKLRSSVDKGSSDELDALVGQIRDTEVARQRAVMDLEDSVMAVLSARQRAQYLVSREKFLREMHQMAEEARMRRFSGDRGMKGMGDGPRPLGPGGMGGRPGGPPGGGPPMGGGGGPRGHR